MIQQFNNLSSWRKEEIKIKQHELYTLNYRDTMPNIFVVVNPNVAVLKIGITNLPRTDSFEFKVDYNSTETVGRPIGTHNLYILNDSSKDVTVTVFSIEQEFDPQILKNLNVNLQDYEIQTSAVISGFKAGVAMPIESEVKDNQQEIISSLANLKSVHLGNLQTAINALLKENTFTGKMTSILSKLDSIKSGQFTGGVKETTYNEKVTSILSKLDTLISGQSSGGGGGSETSYDDTELLALLTEWKNAQGWTNLAAKLSSFDSQLSEILTTIQSDESNTLELHKNMKKLLNALTVFEDDTISGSGVATYLNNVTSFSFTASKKCKLHFGWLFYDGGATANLKIGDTEVLTIMKDERLTDIELELAQGDVVTITSTEPLYRIKYWTY